MSTVTYKKLESVQKLAIVNSRLRHGDMAKIAKNSDSNPTSVRNVIEGIKEDKRILNAAYEIVRRRKKNFHVIKDLQIAQKKNQVPVK
jgi:hypothetical protein